MTSARRSRAYARPSTRRRDRRNRRWSARVTRWARRRLRQIRDTLHAAATGGSDSRVALWRGTLDTNLSPAGFGETAAGDPDPPELTKALAALRRSSAPTGRPSLRVLHPARKKPSVDREAERLAAAARQARSTAAAKREQADRLAQAARLAEAEAVAADEAAHSAEDALASHREGA